MSNNRLIVRLLAPLAVALFVVAITIGLSQPTLVDTANGAVVCASAFGTGDISGATEAGQASCAALTSERQMWSFTLLGLSLGLLVGLFWVALSTSHRPEDDFPAGTIPAGPIPTGAATTGSGTGWVDYPAAGPVDSAGPAPQTFGQAPQPAQEPQPAQAPQEPQAPQDRD